MTPPIDAKAVLAHWDRCRVGLLSAFLKRLSCRIGFHDFGNMNEHTCAWCGVLLEADYVSKPW